ncbi:MAG: GNAT family N-acetyltransferase [Chloroflexi bacterium]|nr:GNAT family N-acetyltransferase [Chloroflexota bacterium]
MSAIKALPGATIFHHPAWLQTLGECYGYRPFVVTVSDSHGVVEAGLPCAEVRSRLTGRRWVSLPFTDYCPPLYRDDPALASLTDSLLKLAEQRRTPRIELRWEFPSRTAIHPYSHHVLHILRLEPDTQCLGRRLDTTHRQNIRAAKKHDLRIERGADIEHMRAFYQLQVETRQRKGIPAQPWAFFEKLTSTVLGKKLGFVLLAYADDDCLAGAVFLHWGGALMCKYAASREETLGLRPNNLIFWTAICWGCENGFTTFDMGRTALENTGLREFKSRWGAEETSLIYATIGADPPSPQDGRLMRAIGAVIRRAPPWVCRISGDVLYRHVG